MANTATKKTVFICNLAIIALCIVSIVAYFIMPFWRVNIKYTLTAETLEEILPDDTDTGSEDVNSIYEGINFSELLDEDIPLSISIELQTADVLGAMGSDANKLVENILYNNVHNIIDQMDPYINDMVQKLVKTVVKTTFKEELKKQVKESLGEGTTDEQTQEELNNMGLSDEYIDEKTDKLVDTIYTPGATVDDAVNETIDIVKDSIQKMQTDGSEEYQNAELSPEAEAELRAELEEKFKHLENEDGTLDPEGFTTDFLLDMLKGEEAASDVTGASLATPLSAKADDLTEEQNEAKEELKQVLTDKLMELIGDASDVIAMVLQYISYVVLFTFVIWALPILKILIKMGSKNNAIKLGGPIWLGSIPFLVLCAAPMGALMLLGDKIAQSIGGLSITFFSCSIVSFIIGIVLAVFTLFFYGRLRKKLKYGGAK